MKWLDPVVAGARLFARWARGEYPPDAPVVVYTTFGPADAHFVRGLLENEGIRAEVREGLPLYGTLPVTRETLPSVWVAARDAPRADRIVRDLHVARVANGEAWRCPACGETIGSTFSACWQCGRSRPEQPGA